MSTIATGDVSLEDVRQYREERLKAIGMELLTPLWGSDAGTLVRRFIDDGFEAVTVCVSAQRLDESFLGHPLDHALLCRLPQGVDPGGENGEYHSFVHDGPLFASPIAVELGEVVARNGHCYQDLIPGA
jgi:diphthamide synthase (EF-2-diphthine--ammonia ligase)